MSQLQIWFSCLLIFWNLWAFAGHIITRLVSEQNFILPDGGLIPVLYIGSWKEVLYYLLKMDHLLCVPALLCFYFGLKRILFVMSRNSPGEMSFSSLIAGRSEISMRW